MERNANYALVGLSTLILFIGAVVFAVWLMQLRFAQDYDVYDIVFQGPVRGLSQGGEVHFNGIKVGEVTKIDLDPSDPTRVIARTRVTSNVPIRQDSYATLEPLGVTGVNLVQITAGTPSKPLLKDVTPKGQIPKIQSQRSTLADLLEGGGTVLTRTVEALDRLNRVMSDKNIKTFGDALADTQAVTAELAKHKDMIGDAQKALQDIDAAAQQIAELSQSTKGLVDNDGKKTLADFDKAAQEVGAAAKDLRGMVAELQGPTADFAKNGLPQITDAVTALQSAATSLERLSNELESNPQGLVSKAPAQEVKVKP
ncbi:MlaD family protein [Phenylobacterium sp.]|uniref:MlaD family protein n=1 Tax=Phenylobacterium sp. TaxID=1871053 RepID=UPI0035B1F371